MAKKNVARQVIHLECTEARGLGETPARGHAVIDSADAVGGAFVLLVLLALRRRFSLPHELVSHLLVAIYYLQSSF